MNLDFCLRYFKDNLNVFFIKNKKNYKSQHFNYHLFRPNSLGSNMVARPSAWVMSDPDIKLKKKNREKKRREDRISIEGIKNS